MAINQVTFNSVNFWEELGAALTAPVAYPIPAEIKEQVKIKGMNGSLTEATGYFNDLELKLNFKVLFNRAKEKENRTFNGLKRTINLLFNQITDDKLSFSDIPDRYYKIKGAGVGAVVKLSDHEAEFSVSFICDPFLYNPKEAPETQTGNITYNGDIPNAPVIKFSTSQSTSTTVLCDGNALTFTTTPGLVEINANPYALVTIDGTPVKSEGKQIIFTKGTNNISIRGPVFSGLQIIKNERYLG